MSLPALRALLQRRRMFLPGLSDQQRCTAMNAPPRAWRAAICSTGTRPARMGATCQQTPRPGCRDRQGLPASGGCARSRVVVPTARRRGERTVLTHHHLVAAQRQSHRPVATTFRRRGGGRRVCPAWGTTVKQWRQHGPARCRRRFRSGGILRRPLAGVGQPSRRTATFVDTITFAAPSRRHSRIRRLVASLIESWSSPARAFLNRDRSRSPARVLGHPVGHARG